MGQGLSCDRCGSDSDLLHRPSPLSASLSHQIACVGSTEQLQHTAGQDEQQASMRLPLNTTSTPAQQQAVRHVAATALQSTMQQRTAPHAAHQNGAMEGLIPPEARVPTYAAGSLLDRAICASNASALPITLPPPTAAEHTPPSAASPAAGCLGPLVCASAESQGLRRYMEDRHLVVPELEVCVCFISSSLHDSTVVRMHLHDITVSGCTRM